MGHLGFGKIACVAAVFCVANAVAGQAQTFTTLHSFDVSDGYSPYYGTLVQGTDGNLYGTTTYGGTLNGNVGGNGTVFKITRQGKLTTLYDFCAQTNNGVCADGESAQAGVIQAANGKFYGTTAFGGNPYGVGGCINPDGCGTVFEMTPAGNLTTLYNFCSQANCADGASPEAAGLIQASNGNIYGATPLYADNNGAVNGGTIFSIAPAGALSTLFNFCYHAPCPPGITPNTMVQAPNGALYGTAAAGGAYKEGTFFVIGPNGKFTTLHSFNGLSEGADPGAVVSGNDGNFYGTTGNGGANFYGTVFKITPAGQVTTLYNFCAQPGCADGAYPIAGLVQGSDGNFYGITVEGGNTAACADFRDNGCGTIFEITPAGQFTSIYRFCSQTNCPDGVAPLAGLTQGTDGSFYGTSAFGGIYNATCSDGCGIVFGISTGLGEFVKSNPSLGRAGSKINILGNGLNGANSVTFNGTPATFQVISGTYIKAQVPSGATTGTIVVTTPGGTLSSNVAFQVLP